MIYMAAIGMVGCVITAIAPLLKWIAYKRMNDRLDLVSLICLCGGEVMIAIYLGWFFAMRG